MGGTFAFLTHVDSLQILGGDADAGSDNMVTPTLIQVGDQQQIGQCWAMETVMLKWSGKPIDQTKTVTLKHAGTGAFLRCHGNGALETSAEYSSVDCQWVVRPVLSGSAIALNKDAFYIISKPHRYVLAVTKANQLRTAEAGTQSEMDCFIAKLASPDDLYKLKLTKDLMAQYLSLGSVISAFNQEYGSDMAAVEQDARKMHADSTQWRDLRRIGVIAAIESVISVSAGGLLDQLKQFMRKTPANPNTLRHLMISVRFSSVLIEFAGVFSDAIS